MSTFLRPVGRRLRVGAVAAVTAALMLLAAGPATAAAPPYDPVIGRIPYQPGPMLVDPGASANAANAYGFNLGPVGGLTNPAYYELRDSYTVKLYFNYRGSTDSATKNKEKHWIEGLDDVMSTMVLETNKWVGGRLHYEPYDGDTWPGSVPANEIAIVFATIPATGIASPSRALDNRGAIYNGGLIRLTDSDVWTRLVDDSNDGDRWSRYAMAIPVMHELGHTLGLAHYNTQFRDFNTLMSSIRVADDVSSWNDVWTPGDKAGLMNMAGWRDRAVTCADTGSCNQIWEKGDGIAWPPQPPQHTYDRVH
ncbi:hypothetical protein QR77_19805 [Streptomyces sp. 150FB]|uniref:hypothetical protein n=1 Tax=Streptomyces sp. 150FB TaxID=1576605 RepID=UPI00058910BF|nr:hypothetical protein [Streptomyces sp. 150FB]KIF75536.1 hypothetical protein QR77_19805 [Streptomyces sp. 150FB]